MSAKASDEWLSNLRAYVSNIQKLYSALFIFVAVIVYTLCSQYFDLRRYNSELTEVKRSRGLAWNKVQIFYEEAFSGDENYLKNNLDPWYDLVGLTGVKVVQLISNQKEKGDVNPKLIEADKLLASIFKDLGHYNQRIRSINSARRFNIPFEDLESDKLEDLVFILSFYTNEREKEFKEGFEYSKNFAQLAIKVSSDANLDIPKKQKDIFQKALELEDFIPLDHWWLTQNIYGYDKNKLSAEEMTLISRVLAEKRFTSIGQLDGKLVDLNNKISSLKEETVITIPILSISVPLKFLALVAAILNLILLAWYLRFIKGIKYCVRNYKQTIQQDDKELLHAVLAKIPFIERNLLLRRLINPSILILPSIISIILLVSYQVGLVNRYSLLTFFLIALNLILALRITNQIQKVHDTETHSPTIADEGRTSSEGA